MPPGQSFMEHTSSQAIRALTHGLGTAKRHATGENILQAAYLAAASVLAYGVSLAVYRGL